MEGRLIEKGYHLKFQKRRDYMSIENETSIKAITDFVSNIGTINDKVEEMFTPLKEYVDEIGHVIKPVQLILTGLSLINKIKMKRFLKTLSMVIDEHTITNEYMRKLEVYLKKEANLEYIANTISSSIQTKSSRCSAIMGYYAGTILKKLKDIEYMDLVIINALSIMNNKDIDNFVLLYDTFFERQKTMEIGSLRVYDLKEEFNSFGLRVFELENTIEKMKSVQVIGYDFGGMGNVGNAWGAFKFNANSTYLYEIIAKSKVMDIVESDNN